MLPNTNSESALKVCERLLNTVRDMRIECSDGRYFFMTLSMGISEYPKDGEETYFLFNHADEAMYYSKRMGKNRISLYQPEFSKL